MASRSIRFYDATMDLPPTGLLEFTVAEGRGGPAHVMKFSTFETGVLPPCECRLTIVCHHLPSAVSLDRRVRFAVIQTVSRLKDRVREDERGPVLITC